MATDDVRNQPATAAWIAELPSNYDELYTILTTEELSDPQIEYLNKKMKDILTTETADYLQKKRQEQEQLFKAALMHRRLEPNLQGAVPLGIFTAAVQARQQQQEQQPRNQANQQQRQQQRQQQDQHTSNTRGTASI